MAKQIFNSTEKSNFILNLTEEGYSKLASIALIAACTLTSVTTAIPVISGKAVYTFTAMGLSVAGVFCMIVALIGAIKKYLGKSQGAPLIMTAVMFVFGLISMFMSYDLKTGFYGYTGRDEGFLTIVYYICFFAAAACIKNSKAIGTFTAGIIWVGLLNSAMGLVQSFAGKFSFYKTAGLNTTINAASGFAQSPLFLAMMLTASLIAAVTGIAGSQSKGYKVFCAVSACVFSFVIMLTYSIIGIAGIALSLIIAVAAVFVLKAPKACLLSVLTIIAPAGAAVGLVCAGVIGNVGQYALHDGYNLWISDAYMRISASGLPGENVDINSETDVYYTLNRKAIDIISGYPLLGTGPDQLVYPQLYTMGNCDEYSSNEDIIIQNRGTIDRVYNEYLNCAAMKGVIFAAAFVGFIISVLAIGRRSFKKQKSPELFCVLMITAAGALLFLVGCSNTAFSPIFWSACGCACAALPKQPEEVSKNKPKKNKKSK